MRSNNMRWIKIDQIDQALRAMQQVGVDQSGAAYMKGKALARVIKLEKVSPPAAHILKQEMLALGGDAATHRNLIVNRLEHTDVLLLGNEKQLRGLARKCKVQPFGLKKIADDLLNLIQTLEKPKVDTIQCRGMNLKLGERTQLMGILNLTPDSFSDGGKFAVVDRALTQAKQLIEDGADILDIGAESTRPGYQEVDPATEWARLEPILKELLPHCPIPISVDTQKSQVAEKALNLGVQIINDIWGFQGDPHMAEVVGGSGAAVVLMHNRQDKNYVNIMGEITSSLDRSIELALAKGVKEDQIMIDPGIGFANSREGFVEILSRLDELRIFGLPILLGVSRKSVIDKTLDLPVEERLEPTIALGTLGVVSGVDVLRVHDVYEHRKAIRMADEIIRRKRGAAYEGK